MQCPKCQFENPTGVNFCGECGAKLERICPGCNSPNPLNFKFCSECGHNLIPAKKISEKKSEAEKPASRAPTKKSFSDIAPLEGERKHITVLFSDLTGYTTMSEKLDPEDLKGITSRIFREISKIVGKYDGFIEKYAGDAVMALFGAPKAHEDDPIRAIKAAREIHEIVDAISPEVETMIGQPVSMHTGINTGLVVTGEIDMERGTHGVAGDTINLASRISNLAKSGEILVDVETCRQIEGHFTCEYLGKKTVKGKADPIQVHKVLSQKDKPVTIHRLSGLRADLIGRKVELAELSEAVENLREGRGRVFSICGAAGTGKSRLVEEFKSTLDLEQIQWIEGHAYAYAQNTPYFPLIDLLNRVLSIEENEPPEKVREKVGSGIECLVGKRDDIVPYVGRLYSLNYPEVEDVSPEFWKSRLQSATMAILSALANKAPTIYFLEDLQWADPSFVELLRQACFEIPKSAIVLCVFRPTFNLFTEHQLRSVGKYYHDIQLKDLSLSEAQNMLESLLGTGNIPSDLKRLVQSKAEGNPFYLEELINSLIEAETLIRDNGSWKVTRPITESDVSSTIHGVISGRLDRLKSETKRIIQEASVIGRTFLVEILKKITDLKQDIDGYLISLEHLDFIRTRALQPELEYVFKHALTQEVVYSGLLKKERREIHERIGIVIEKLFDDRIPEFYETLAYHFFEGKSEHKAIDYLLESGDKSLKLYALEESHEYFNKAYEILNQKPDKSQEELGILIDIINRWASVFYFKGDVGGFMELLRKHERDSEFLENESIRGMYYAWMGWALGMQEHVNESFKYLYKALEIGEKIEDQSLIAYACTWLVFSCIDSHLEKGIVYGQRAYEIGEVIETDQYLFFKPLCGMMHVHYLRGEKEKLSEIGEILLEYGTRHNHIRSLTVGNICMGYNAETAGDLTGAVGWYQQAVEISKDPIYTHWAGLFLGLGYLRIGKFREAYETLQEVLSFCQKFDYNIIGTSAKAGVGVLLIEKGQMSQGLQFLEEARQSSADNNREWVNALTEYLLGFVYFQIVEGGKPMNFSTIIKNLGFLVKNVPRADRKAEKHFKKAIEILSNIGANGLLGQAYFQLGLLYRLKKRAKDAKKCFSAAIKIFEQSQADIYLKQVNETMISL